MSVDAKTAAMEEFVFLILLRVRTVACKTYHSAKQKQKGRKTPQQIQYSTTKIEKQYFMLFKNEILLFAQETWNFFIHYSIL